MRVLLLVGFISGMFFPAFADDTLVTVSPQLKQNTDPQRVNTIGCDTFSPTSINLPHHGIYSNVGQPDVADHWPGDIGLTFTLTQESVLSVRTCFPGSDVGTQIMMYSGTGPCDNNSTFLGYSGVDLSCDYANGLAAFIDMDCVWSSFQPGTYTMILTTYIFEGEGNMEIDIAATPCGGGVAEADELPGTFALGQNYPNPFNPTTQIDFNLPETSISSLRVYNSLGFQVANLADGLMQSGAHSVTFDATGLSSGVYYYILQNGDQLLTNKLLLLK
jgi:hypothetical protein